jgi:flagellar biosynthesis protein FlhB
MKKIIDLISIAIILGIFFLCLPLALFLLILYLIYKIVDFLEYHGMTKEEIEKEKAGY